MLRLLCIAHVLFISTIRAVVYVISILPYLFWPSYKYSVNCNIHEVPVCSTVASRSLLHLQIFIYPITEAAVSYEMSVHVHHITRRHIPQKSILPRARGENLKSYNITIRSKCQYDG